MGGGGRGPAETAEGSEFSTGIATGGAAAFGRSGCGCGGGASKVGAFGRGGGGGGRFAGGAEVAGTVEGMDHVLLDVDSLAPTGDLTSSVTGCLALTVTAGSVRVLARFASTAPAGWRTRRDSTRRRDGPLLASTAAGAAGVGTTTGGGGERCLFAVASLAASGVERLDVADGKTSGNTGCCDFDDEGGL